MIHFLIALACLGLVLWIAESTWSTMETAWRTRSPRWIAGALMGCAVIGITLTLAWVTCLT